MKKAAAGFLAGVLLTMSATAYADDIQSAIGKLVDGTYPLVIDGKKAAKDVIVVDGTSYLPVRAAGELFGYDVDFVKEQVVLTKKKTSSNGTSGSSDGTGASAGGAGGSVSENGVPLGPVSVKTSLFTVGQSKATLTERDGTLYISALVFEKYLSATSTTVTITLPGRSKLEFPYNAEYKTGVAGYNENGLFVKLSALGLSAVSSGSSGVLLVQE
ncbi:hypothetical protein [Gorillibacterium sp. sgz5001074]|uniref:hypothetical protein n=1 Tax=Gorillibacterium sp. sgz5001074 TaxID=3446695 RepID=UPI003F67C78E